MGQSQKLGPDHGPTVMELSEEFVGPQSMINRTQYIRLLEQSLANLGFREVAAALESASVRPPMRLTTCVCVSNRIRLIVYVIVLYTRIYKYKSVGHSATNSDCEFVSTGCAWWGRDKRPGTFEQTGTGALVIWGCASYSSVCATETY
jgi:hypothetical protein